MTDGEESAYIQGERAALTRIMKTCAVELIGTDDPLAKVGHLVAEREAALAVLRRLCGEHGDLDWSEDMHLADIIEKHLGRYLFEEDAPAAPVVPLRPGDPIAPGDEIRWSPSGFTIARSGEAPVAVVRSLGFVPVAGVEGGPR